MFIDGGIVGQIYILQGWRHLNQSFIAIVMLICHVSVFHVSVFHVSVFHVSVFMAAFSMSAFSMSAFSMSVFPCQRFPCQCQRVSISVSVLSRLPTFS